MNKGPQHANDDEPCEPGVQEAKQGKRSDGYPAGGVEPDAQQCGGDQGGCDGRHLFSSFS